MDPRIYPGKSNRLLSWKLKKFLGIFCNSRDWKHNSSSSIPYVGDCTFKNCRCCSRAYLFLRQGFLQHDTKIDFVSEENLATSKQLWVAIFQGPNQEKLTHDALPTLQKYQSRNQDWGYQPKGWYWERNTFRGIK